MDIATFKKDIGKSKENLNSLSIELSNSLSRLNALESKSAWAFENGLKRPCRNEFAMYRADIVRLLKFYAAEFS